MLLSWGCGESFSEQAPFSQVDDTVRLDYNNWYFLGSRPQKIGEAHVFPFSYRLLGSSFDGFLAYNPPRVYILAAGEDLSQRALLFDPRLQPGDTIHKYSQFQYHLLLDRRVAASGEEVFYLLRRSRIGIKNFRERSIWAVSMEKGLLAAAAFSIGTNDGAVSFESIIGESAYFRDPELIRRIQYYDYDVSSFVDRDRNLIYGFDKFKGTLKSRDYKAAADLYEYAFDKNFTRELTDFRIQLRNGQLELQAGDSCFYFTPELELQRSGRCP